MKSPWLKLVVLIGLLFGAWKCGYWAGHSNRLDQIVQQVDTVLSPSSLPSVGPKRMHSPLTKLARIPNSNENPNPTDNNLSAHNPISYESLVAKHHLEAKNKFFSSIFSQSTAGKSYIQMLTLLKSGPVLPGVKTVMPETDWVGDQLKTLRSIPSEAISELRQSLPQLGTGYSVERQYLVQFVGSLDTDPKEKIDLLSQELIQGTGLAPTSKDDPAIFNGSVTLQVMLNLTNNPDDIEPTLKQAIANQRDSTLKLMLLSTYSTKFPTQALKLRSDLGL